jgi:hypothetical protein
LIPNAINGRQAIFRSFTWCTSSPAPTTRTREPENFRMALSSSKSSTASTARKFGRFSDRTFRQRVLFEQAQRADVTVKDTKRYAETGGWGYSTSITTNRRPHLHQRARRRVRILPYGFRQKGRRPDSSIRAPIIDSCTRLGVSTMPASQHLVAARWSPTVEAFPVPRRPQDPLPARQAAA